MRFSELVWDSVLMIPDLCQLQTLKDVSQTYETSLVHPVCYCATDNGGKYSATGLKDALFAFHRLCCPPNPGKKLAGEPFAPTLAIPFDMFPHTVHCELVLLFTR